MTRPARDVTEEMFNRVREKTDWPIDTGDCLWGYFFHDTDLSKLTSAGRLLEAQVYRIAAIFLVFRQRVIAAVGLLAFIVATDVLEYSEVLATAEFAAAS